MPTPGVLVGCSYRILSRQALSQQFRREIASYGRSGGSRSSLANAVSRSARWRNQGASYLIHDRCHPQIAFDTITRPSDRWAILYAKRGAVLEQEMYNVDVFGELLVEATEWRR